MYIILSERNTGKTTDLIFASNRHGYYIVCPTHERCSEVFAMAIDIERTIPFPISFDEFLSHDYNGKGVKGFLIDDADQLLQRLTDVPIKIATFTREE